MDWHNEKAAERYKPGEELTAPFARILVQKSGLSKASSSEDVVVLDNACGTGIATSELYSLLPEGAKAKLHLTCGDISGPMLESVDQRIAENGWKGARTQKADALALPFSDDTFTHVITNFGIIIPPNPRLALRETHRVLRPNGISAFSIWELSGWFPVLQRAIASIPEAPPLPSFASFIGKWSSSEDDPWTEGDFIESTAKEAGFVDVNMWRVENVTRHRDVETYWKLYGEMLRIVLKFFWTEKQREEMGALVEPAVRQVLKEKFGEGEVSLKWAAWCVTARKPKA